MIIYYITDLNSERRHIVHVSKYAFKYVKTYLGICKEVSWWLIFANRHIQTLEQFQDSVTLSWSYSRESPDINIWHLRDMSIFHHWLSRLDWICRRGVGYFNGFVNVYSTFMTSDFNCVYFYCEGLVQGLSLGSLIKAYQISIHVVCSNSGFI